MDRRNQFTFYRSFWDAARGLPKRDRLPILEAIIGYALDGVMPEGLQQKQEVFFMLCKPNLDASRKKAAMAGGKRKDSKSENKKEGEIDNESKKESEFERENEKKGQTGFERFWQLYPRKEGKLKAKEAYIRCGVEEDVLLGALVRQSRCQQWQREEGRYIPLPATWLNQRRWEDEQRTVVSGRIPDAKEREAVRRLMEDDT